MIRFIDFVVIRNVDIYLYIAIRLSQQYNHIMYVYLKPKWTRIAKFELILFYLRRNCVGMAFHAIYKYIQTEKRKKNVHCVTMRYKMKK